LAAQAFINMLVVTGRLPVTGLPLPFVSSGGTSLIVSLAMLGVLINVSRAASLDSER
jgi:cell division protein FtsW